MRAQNILIGAMAVAIAALGVITYQQQHYIEQLATAQQSSSISKQIKKLNRRMDDLESQIDSAQANREDIDALRSDLEELDARLSDVENTPSPVEWHDDFDISNLENRVNDAESDIDRLKDRTNTFP
ncbi:hypothetical protein [Mitsuokella multacida]|uniref:hypothetical protein n=1 Tax=Mitsuokella multacida TaxID=52226 RepID=UPI0039F58721